MPERHYGLIIASLVAVVAIVGLVLNFSGMTGAIIQPFQYIGEQGKWFDAGEQFFGKCHVDLEEMTKELAVVKGEFLTENECCSKMCGQLCEGLSENCYSGCESGCDLGERKAYGHL